MTTYRIHGRVLESPIALPELEPVDAPPDLHLRLGEVPVYWEAGWYDVWRFPDGRTWVQACAVDGIHRISYAGTAEFLVDPARGLIVAEALDCAEPAMRHFVLDQVIPLMLSLDGTVLHASGAVISGDGCAFLGEGGAGKSTLALAVGRGGHPVITDDGMLVHVCGDSVQVAPAYDGIRLWQDGRKSRLQGDVQYARDPVPLRHLFVIEREPAAETTIAPLSPRDAVMACLEHSYRLDVAPAALASQFDRAFAIAARVDAWRIAYRRDADRVGDVARALAAHVARSPTRGSTVRAYAAG